MMNLKLKKPLSTWFADSASKKRRWR